jgi:hypothetical protein
MRRAFLSFLIQSIKYLFSCRAIKNLWFSEGIIMRSVFFIPLIPVGWAENKLSWNFTSFDNPPKTILNTGGRPRFSQNSFALEIILYVPTMLLRLF